MSSGLRHTRNLLEAIPALGSRSKQIQGEAKLVPDDFKFPTISLHTGINKVGRDPQMVDCVVSSPHVSRQHCEIQSQEGRFWVRDLNSHNGTYVNGVKTLKQELKIGDQLGLSRRVTFTLAMDSVLESPEEVILKIDEEKPQRKRPAHTAEVPHLEEAPDKIQPVIINQESAPAMAPDQSAADNLPPTLPQVEEQRKIMTILYQLSLQCLLADNVQDIERLITNVLPRLIPLDAGFILYRQEDNWRACLCTNSQQRTDISMMRSFHRMAMRSKAPVILQTPAEIHNIGLTRGTALMAPLIFNDQVEGVLGAINNQPSTYTPALLDIAVELANVAVAALRPRKFAT